MSPPKLPIALPGKIICVGLNYKDHAAEAKVALPERPLLFAKWSNSLVGDGDAIMLPGTSRCVDFEAELGVVVGRRARNVDAKDALNLISGYLCVNDISARDVQVEDVQWTRGKSFDTFCPIGPALVPASAIKDPQKLAIKLTLNGQAMQDSNTANMVFGVAELIEFISRDITLEPGDLIATGTPGGVGYYKDPRVSLKRGDIVQVEIEDVGVLTNTVT
ncbi:fumarylacetoacetate hydrolase family protein [Mesorhizobium sp. CA8]|uniref:fumarylacetoacetate hydrolase family protein n=1 Tax=unclassified Mesorhizobium TaxID=325217 RepID=UPI001CCBBC9C|nr:MULTISPECIES: fumarylacetoacetate hydrolase family protein [unclassified Mesorhizobium]MBZ9761680.1 fumarylacetoacetate hydrolase family protein [Mesorhizobium sp. CA8]MBZ9820566.1 fumarylacetoacetate hydrolase family protein [Mesorhizobium sp. CA4]